MLIEKSGLANHVQARARRGLDSSTHLLLAAARSMRANFVPVHMIDMTIWVATSFRSASAASLSPGPSPSGIAVAVGSLSLRLVPAGILTRELPMSFPASYIQTRAHLETTHLSSNSGFLCLLLELIHTKNDDSKVLVVEIRVCQESKYDDILPSKRRGAL